MEHCGQDLIHCILGPTTLYKICHNLPCSFSRSANLAMLMYGKLAMGDFFLFPKWQKSMSRMMGIPKVKGSTGAKKCITPSSIQNSSVKTTKCRPSLSLPATPSWCKLLGLKQRAQQGPQEAKRKPLVVHEREGGRATPQSFNRIFIRARLTSGTKTFWSKS